MYDLTVVRFLFGVFALKTAKKNLRASQNHSFQRNHNVTEPFHHPAYGTVEHKNIHCTTLN